MVRVKLKVTEVALDGSEATLATEYTDSNEDQALKEIVPAALFEIGFGNNPTAAEFPLGATVYLDFTIIPAV